MTAGKAQTPQARRFAAIDLGTNSFHVVVVQVDDAGRYEVLTREKETVRLSRGAGDLEAMTPEAMDRGVRVLGRMAQLARSHGAEPRAVGTSALREASNQSEFLARVREECQLEIEVIPGPEEARLIYLGVLQALPIQDQQILAIDIGGGSTEFVIGQAGKVALAASLKLGAIRMTDRFFAQGDVSAGQVRKCRKFVRVMLAGVVEDIRNLGFGTAIGCSGTIETLAQLAVANRKTGAAPDAPASLAELNAACDAVLACKSSAQREGLPGVGAARADIIPAGAIILQEALAMLGVSELTVSPFALREGIVFDTLARLGLRAGPAGDLRRDSVEHFAASFERTGAFDLAAGRHTARLALRLFEQLSDLGIVPKEFGAESIHLEAAAALHNVGLVVAHSGHHKHSHYLISNSSKLLGFSPEELELIALLARYHRKALPAKKHPEYANASAEVKKKLHVLGPILRIAVGLERSGHARVADVRITKNGKQVSFGVVAAAGAEDDLNLEIWAARIKAEWFEQEFGLETDFHLEMQN